MKKSRMLFLPMSCVFLSSTFFHALAVYAVPAPFLQSLENLRNKQDQKNHSLIRVKISNQNSQVTIRGFDLRVFEGQAQSLVSAPDRLSEWKIQCENGKIFGKRIGQGGVVLLQQPVQVSSIVGVFQVQNHPYRGNILIYPSGLGCEIVNHVDIEKYLTALVNSEFSSKWNPESIAAQAVAARTYALYKMGEIRGKYPLQHYDVDSTEKDQVYDGFMKEDTVASRIVEKTRGVVLTVPKGEPLKAFYHSTCGGSTQLPEQIWNEKVPGFKRAVPCPFCYTSPRFSWATELTREEISAALLKSTGRLDRWPVDWKAFVRWGDLKTIEIKLSHLKSRAKELMMIWSWQGKALALSMNANRFRNLIGADKLRSTYLDHPVSHWENGHLKWVFSGRGNGHGVGMCQWGAKVMGEKGYKMAAILNHYYPDAVLKKMW